MPYFALPHRPIVRAIYYPYREKEKHFTNPKLALRGTSLESSAMLVGRKTNSRDSTCCKEQTQTAFMMSFLYIYAQLPWNSLTSYMLNWVIEIFFEILVKTELGVIDGTFGSNEWFWICLYGATAAASVMQKFEQDATQKTYWMAEFYHKLRWISSLLDLQDWSTAKSVLRSVRWEEGFDGEDTIHQIWETAVTSSAGYSE